MRRVIPVAKATAAALLALVAVLGCEPDTPVGVTEQPRPTLSAAGSEAQAEAADHFLVEFTGSVDQLTAAVEGVGATVYRAHPEIGVAMVRGLDDTRAGDLEESEGVERVTRDLIVQWQPPLDESALEAAEAKWRWRCNESGRRLLLPVSVEHDADRCAGRLGQGRVRRS